jgi:WD40 repeat protein
MTYLWIIRRYFVLICVLLVGCGELTDEAQQTFHHVDDGIDAANISADGSLAVISNLSNGISVWDLKNNVKRYIWNQSGEGNNLVTNIHIAFDNSYALTSDQDSFALWNLNNGEPEGFWRIDESTIRDIAVANQGLGILVGRSSGKVMFFEPLSGRRLEFLGHSEKVNSVDLSPNGFYALSGGNDYVAYLWDTRSGQVVHKFDHPSRVTKVALDDEGRYAFTADSKRDARIWDLATGQEVSNLKYFERQKIFSTAVFSKDGRYLLTGSPARRLNLWDVKTGKELKSWRVTPRAGTRPQTAVVLAVGFLDNNQLISESSSGLAEIWSINGK